MSNFDTAILTVLKHEGFYSNDPHDPGGPTKYGISLRYLQSLGDLNHDGFLDGDFNEDGRVNSEDIRYMTQADALVLYRVQWWDRHQYEKIINQQIATKVFDLAVNMGAKQAHKCLQRALRSTCNVILLEDGILGEKTFSAVNNANPNELLSALRSEAAGFYRSLNKPRYLTGWLNRAYE
jgi:Putative secretion activating protein